jgi:ankyrin repeat protein
MYNMMNSFFGQWQLRKEFDQLKSELLKKEPDFEMVQQIVSANNELLNKPIGNGGEYVLHYACWKNAPSNIVINFINDNPTIVKQKDNYGYYPLHYACIVNQSEAVIQLLVDTYPDALQKQNIHGYYPLHYACRSNPSTTFTQILFELFTGVLSNRTNW